MQVGVGLMGIRYSGDLTFGENEFSRYYPGGSIAAQFAGKGWLHPGVQVSFGSFTEQADRGNVEFPRGIEPTLFVQTSFFAADFRFQVDLLRRRRFHPFLAAGAGIFFFTPRDAEGNFLGENIFTRPDGESYNTNVFSFPLSAGVMAKLNPVLSLSADYSWRPTTSDYLDNIGSLGRQKGKDRLHGARVCIHINLIPPDRITTPQPLAQALHSAPAPTPALQAQADTAFSNGRNIGTLSKRDWIAIENRALRDRDFLYYPVRGYEKLFDLCRYFHIRPATLRQLNFMVNDELETGAMLRMPNMGIELPPEGVPSL